MFNEKVAIITGGASGIGLATAEKLLKNGAKVVIADCSDSVSMTALNLGENCLGIKCDVSSEEDVKNCVNKTIEKFGRIDYLVANAGIGGGPNKAHEVSFNEWNKVVAVNQTGIFLMNKYVIAEMLKTGGGNIVNTSSMYGLVGTPMSFAYSATKDAMANQLPIGRLGKDEEIANLICYLLGDTSSFITGAVVPIDGGYTAQ